MWSDAIVTRAGGDEDQEQDEMQAGPRSHGVRPGVPARPHGGVSSPSGGSVRSGVVV
jgi:hypothetical protein